ncbi:MAG: hypothetical protein DCC75_09615 [Proteobacteria bacterium]|nr:MAG: hypothetical protein DCC75_09615 [Pseudomonadota bacterium]
MNSGRRESESFLDERTRAEDIILGALGFGEDARIVKISRTEGGFCGSGCFNDGEKFDFENQEALSELEEWALEVLLEGFK